jgi:hypothetical protein
MDDVVRATLRIVSRTGHSQAESMCAWPTAEISWALCSAGLASTSARAARLQVEGVERVVEGLQDPHAARSGGQLGLQLEQDLEVEREVVHLGLEDREVHAPGRVKGARGRGGRVALLGRQEGVVVEQHGVRRRLQEQLDPFAAGRGVSHGDVLVARVDRLHGAAVRPVDQRLALEAGHVDVEAEVHDGLDGLAGPFGGYGTRQPEPGGAPGRAPRCAHLVGFHREGQALGRGNRLPRQHVPLDLQRDGRPVDRGPDALGQHALRAPGGQCDVVMHRKGLPCVTVERTQANPTWWARSVGVRTPGGMKGWCP